MASYAYLLGFIVRNINGLSVSNTGGIYLPSSQLKTTFRLEKFRIDFILPEVKKFFKTLPKIINTETPWHYNSRCRTCEFVNVCRKDAKGSIAMIPYLSLEKASDLKAFIRNRKSDDNDDIEDLANCFNELDIENGNAKASDKDVSTRIKQIIKYDKTLKNSPYLKALETKQAQV